MNHPDLCELIKLWETQINEYLKCEGVGPVKILYGSKIYPKTLLYNTKKTRNNNYIKLKGIWVNDKNMPFLQLWLE